MKKRLKKLLIIFAVFVVVMLFVLTPSGGPSMATAFKDDAEVILYATNITQLWERLETSKRFATFREKPLWQSIEKTDDFQELLENYNNLKKDGITRARLGYLIDTEVGMAAYKISGRYEFVLAFRIGLVANTAEIILSVLNLEALQKLHWQKWGDLLVLATDKSLLAKNNDISMAKRFNLTEDALSITQPSLAVAVKEPERYLHFDAEVKDMLTLGGLPQNFSNIAIALRIDGDTIYEEESLKGTSPTRSLAFAKTPLPQETFFKYDFSPGKARAIELIQKELQGVVGSKLNDQLMLQGALYSVVGGDVRILLNMQDPDAPRGGFPAEIIMVELRDASRWENSLNVLFSARGGVAIYNEGDALPSNTPYIVKRSVNGVKIYEMVIMLTRRYEGYRPSIAVLDNAVVFSTSFVALSKYISEESSKLAAKDSWLTLEGRALSELHWVTPQNLTPLKNSYNFMVDIAEHSPGAAKMLLDPNRLDTDLLWDMVESVLSEVNSHTRSGAFDNGTTRLRGVWKIKP